MKLTPARKRALACIFDNGPIHSTALVVYGIQDRVINWLIEAELVRYVKRHDYYRTTASGHRLANQLFWEC